MYSEGNSSHKHAKSETDRPNRKTMRRCAVQKMISEVLFYMEQYLQLVAKW